MGRILTFALMVGLLVPAAGLTRTWRVERDGTGDTTTIQPAIDQSAVGDTVLIGPGRYTEYQTVTLENGWFTTDVYVLVTQDSLTIMGTSREDVIIGPNSATFINFSPKGIVYDTSVAASVQSLTVRSVYDGVYTRTQGTVEDCTFIQCGHGVSGFGDGVLGIRDCEVLASTVIGVIAYDPVRSFVVTDCTFRDNRVGLDAVSIADARVTNCDFSGGRLGVQYEAYTTGVIENCKITQASIYGICLIQGGSADIRNVMAMGEYAGIFYDGSYLRGTDSIVRGGSGAAIVGAWSNASLHGCHVLRGTGRLIEMQVYGASAGDHWDMRNNYWGTASRDSIAAWIWDGNDDPNIHAFVDFEPFSATPLPVEKKSLGGVKSLYKR